MDTSTLVSGLEGTGGGGGPVAFPPRDGITGGGGLATTFSANRGATGGVFSLKRRATGGVVFGLLVLNVLLGWNEAGLED